MKIEPGCLVTLAVKMADAQGNLLEETDAPLVYLHGADDIFPAVEKALEGQREGFHCVLRLDPDAAFGDYDAGLVFLVDRDALGRDVAPGMQVEGRPGVEGDSRIYRVTDVADDVAVLDGNHPLAGMALQFDIRVLGVERPDPATADEPLAQVPGFLRPVSNADLHKPDPHRH